MERQNVLPSTAAKRRQNRSNHLGPISEGDITAVANSGWGSGVRASEARDGPGREGRWVADPGLVVDTDRAVAAAASGASAGLSSSAGSRSRCDERDLLCRADRVHVELAQRDRDLSQLFGASAFSGVARSRGL